MPHPFGKIVAHAGVLSVDGQLVQEEGCKGVVKIKQGIFCRVKRGIVKEPWRKLGIDVGVTRRGIEEWD